MERVNIMWFRRDIRLKDNRALEAALAGGLMVLPLFIFDTVILDQLPSREDKRVSFIHKALTNLNSDIAAHAGIKDSLLCLHGRPADAFELLLNSLDSSKSDNSSKSENPSNSYSSEISIAGVYCGDDYEPYALERDNEVMAVFQKRGIGLHKIKDHVILSPREVLKADGNPYTIYTPYSKLWRATLQGDRENLLKSASLPASGGNILTEKNTGYLVGRIYPAGEMLRSSDNSFSSSSRVKVFGSLPRPEDIGFKDCESPDARWSPDFSIIDNYGKTRDYPAIENGTTGIGVHLRFGTVSIREVAAIAHEHNDTWLGELIWREFFQQIIFNFPHSATGAFKRQYDYIEWRNDESEIERWMAGETGYPLVDAGMRELNTTGHMHNRVRMVVASFLTKHLLVDWQIGEAYFASKLLDYDLASNVGNWQWAAGSGCDAAPYFRVFNPTEQARKFDPAGRYINRWLPELQSQQNSQSLSAPGKYPAPIVDHKFARDRALATYAKALKQQ